MPASDVLLRFANLGFMEAAMTLAGIRLRVVGRDATRCAAATAPYRATRPNTLSFGAGESFDAIFTAPAAFRRQRTRQVRPLQPGLHRADNLVGAGSAASAPRSTSTRAAPAPQAYPNQHPDDAA